MVDVMTSCCQAVSLPVGVACALTITLYLAVLSIAKPLSFIKVFRCHNMLHTLICSFSIDKYLLNVIYVLNTFPSAGVTAINSKFLVS